MPIYEYKCDGCDYRLEKLLKISDEPAKTCPECGEDSLRKLVSAAAFKLKGAGWYETDFKDKKPEKDEKSSGSKETAESGKPSDSEKKKPTSSEKKATPSASSSGSAKAT